MVIEYRGGTYLRQIVASSIEECQALLNRDMDWNALSPVPKSRRIVFEEWDRPVPITGLTNVWCISGHIDSKSVLIHAVATETVGAPSE